MNNFIKSIQQIERNKKINLDGKNLIVVGNNGAGKTSFLINIASFFLETINKQHVNSLQEISDSLDVYNGLISKTPIESNDYINLDANIRICKQLIEKLNKFNIEFISNHDLIRKIKDGNFVFKFFDAYRKYTSASANMLTSIDELYRDFNQPNYHGDARDFFQRYLVSMSNYALIEKGDGCIDEYERVMKIIHKMESDLQYLLDDKSISLIFNRKKLIMEIKQNDEYIFALDKLPSGYSSILAVYAELIMVSELRKIDKAEIQGVVLIDEIDAHLHVTVQKRVFDFFSKSFPCIQFIISTHSPFVVQSVSDAIIYNLSNGEVLEDLSVYSYTSIIKGLLGESSNSSELEKILWEFDDLSRRNEFNKRFYEINDLLNQKFDVLDSRARAIVMSAKARQIDWKEAQGNV